MSWWEVVVNWIADFFNQPIPIIGCTIAGLGTVAWKLLSQTSFGKKIISDIKKSFADLLESFNTLKISFDKTIEENEAKIKQLKEDYERYIAELQAKKDNLETLVVAVCEHINNVKIKELLEQYKSQNKEDLLNTLLNNKEQEVRSELEGRIAALEERLNEKEQSENCSSTEE